MADAEVVTTTKAKKAVKIPIVMKDGRTVEFNEKQKVVKSWTDGAGKPTEGKPAAVLFDFANGESRLVPIDHGGLQAEYAAHGISQKFGDEGAGAESVDDFLYSVDELFDRTSKGEWTTTREGTGLGGVSVLAKALVQITGKPIEAIREFLRPLSPAEKMALRADPSIKPTIDAIEAEKAKSSPVDTAGLLAKVLKAA